MAAASRQLSHPTDAYSGETKPHDQVSADENMAESEL